MIRVVLAAPTAVLRAGLEALLQANPAVEIAGSESPGKQLATAVAQAQPDVLVVEPDRLDGESFEELLELASGPAPVVLLADAPDSGWIAEALRAGIRAVLPTRATPVEIAAAVEAAAAGLAVLNPQDLEDLLVTPASAPAAMPALPGEALSPREVEVLRLMADGLSNKQIAWRLSISEHTVKFHVASILSKFHAASRTDAVTQGIRRGLILL